ncbi:hypothetical protein K505DRAFT_340349 [Melanomma pulvis-pyrius CBS 109.77]|uniref:GIY-YIG domain-containing protein n=1 Tax=Melanomma pulvis-pyrius CBS 109.77 TaxID=1314802 RepID=A0A6A6X2W0_9PLEO|nr:hypothetical protein K505DRAFT_340349 [Melanomma pulvis-pyrius CBS 109.77]
MAMAQDAQSVLAHILARLQEPESKYYERYGEWIKSQEGLEDFMFRIVRPEVWRCLQTGCRSMDACKAVGGDIKFEGRGVYMSAVLGLDKRVRVYIGQSTHIRSRITQHWNFRHRRDNPSLHYHAYQNSIFNTFGILATLPPATPGNQNHLLPGMDCPDLLLNILEMWFCLMFRALPSQTLEEWLPAGAGVRSKEGREQQPMALNITSPLDQGYRGERVWLDLSASNDPLVQDYLNAGERKRSEADFAQRQQHPQQVQQAYREAQKAFQEEQEQLTRKQPYIPLYQHRDPGPPTISTGVAVFAICMATFLGIVVLTSSKSGGPTPRPKGWR